VTRRAWLIDPGDVVLTRHGPRLVIDVLVDGSHVVLVYADGTESPPLGRRTSVPVAA